jgi:aromatic-L-amino-acid/L-tryptophan decarboxylase
VEEEFELACWVWRRLHEIPELEILAEPQLSIVAFAVRQGERSIEDVNRLSREIMERANARRRVYLTSTMVRGRFLIRICVLSFRTHLDRMELALEDIEAAVAEVLRGPAATTA